MNTPRNGAEGALRAVRARSRGLRKGMSGRQPASMAWAQRMLVALVALGLVTTVLIVVLRDELIRSWAEGRPDRARCC